MHILLTGATGFVGQAVGRELVDQGHTLAVLARNPSARLPFPAQIWGWDGKSPPPVEALAHVQGVVHLAGESIAKGRWTSARKQKLWSSRVTSTRILVAALQAGPTPPSVFVCASAVGIYGDRGDEVLVESATPGQGFLADLCREWEQAAQTASPFTRVVNLRFGVVLGAGGFLRELETPFRFGFGAQLGDGAHWLSWIHLEDLARLIAFALMDSQFNGPVNAVAPEPVTNREFTKTLARHLQRPVFLRVPAVVLKVAVGQMTELLLFSQRASAAKARQLGFTFHFENLASALRSIYSKG